MHKLVGIAAIIALCTPGSMPNAADDYAAARAELVAAYQVQDYQAMVAAAERALAARPGYPGARFNLALAQALHGDAAAALQSLRALAAAGIDFRVEEMAEFESLRELPEWEDYRKDIARWREPLGSAAIAVQLDRGDFVPEGIALDADGNVYLGSIRHGLVVRAGDEPDVLSERQGHWSVFGMRFAGDGSLWFASAAVAQLAGVGEDLGKTGLFRLDVDTGAITRAAILPQRAEQQVLGDLVIAGEQIYTTDSLGGALYRYDVRADEFVTVLEPGTFGSPQGLVLDESGEHLYVADYTGGLYRVRVVDGQRAAVRVMGEMSPYGIDGLYRRGNTLIAIQNGIRPHRIVSMRLADDGLTVSAMELLAANLPAFDEPTLGAIRGDRFYFVANSHWNRFDAENGLPPGLSGPIVLELALPGLPAR
jgi:sugar lactone lactonase YvrE